MIETEVHWTCDGCGKHTSTKVNKNPGNVSLYSVKPEGWESSQGPNNQSFCLCGECWTPFVKERGQVLETRRNLGKAASEEYHTLWSKIETENPLPSHPFRVLSTGVKP